MLVLWLDGYTDNWRHRVFHLLEVVAVLVVTNGTGLNEVLVNTNKGGGVTAWDVFDSFSSLAHHKHNTLYGLHGKIVLLSWDEVGTHEAVLWPG